MAGEKSRASWLAAFSVIGIALTSVGLAIGRGWMQILFMAVGVLTILAAIFWATRRARAKGGGGSPS